VADFTQMNALVDRFGATIAVLAFPCNQFGHQTNETNDEILNTLKYVRPGGGFEPKADMFAKVHVNGAGAHPLFAFLRRAIKSPQDDDDTKDSKRNGVADVDNLVTTRGPFDNTTVVTWAPVSRTDCSWNFEKWLCDANGVPVRRYSRYFPTAEIARDLEILLRGGALE
jgi:glutathione peroxidase